MKKAQIEDAKLESELKKFGERLLTVIENSTFTQEEIAYVSKRKQPHINRIVKNPSVITVKTLCKLCLTIGCQIELPKRRARLKRPNRKTINMAQGRILKGKKHRKKNNALLEWHKKRVRKVNPFEDL